MFMSKRFFIKDLFFCLVAGGIFFLGAPTSLAAEATLLMSPSSGEYEVDSTFTVKLQVNSGGSPGINAAEGKVAFDNNVLSVTDVSKNSSIFDLWTQEPSYSNSNGTITFGGGSPSPYSGSGGTVVSITFSAKAEGEAQVTISDGVVLAADGQGTNIYSGAGNAAYTIVAAQQQEEAEPDRPTREEILERRERDQDEQDEQESQGAKPPKPDVSSPTHSETDVWYPDNEPEFNWKILPSLTGISFDISHQHDEDPDDETEGVVETKQYEDIEDGEWYFHLKYQNKYGWGETVHRKFLVDATPPEYFDVRVDNEGDPTNPTPKIIFSTNDETSGIEHYILELGDINKKIAPSEVVSDGFIRTEPLVFGEYDASVAAVDKAGNTASTTASFMVEPLRAPVITSIPELVNKNSELAIRGTSFYSNATVKIYILKKTESGDAEPEVVSVSTDSEGNWSYYRKEGLDNGTYEIWAQLVDGRGAQSRESSKYLLHVQSPSIIQSFGWLIIIILMAVIAALVAYIFYQRKHFLEEKTRIRRETREVKSRLSKIFQALREEVDELIVMADKKPGLSESERNVKEKLEESLDIAEEFIGKEVNDVEKEIKMPKKEEEE